MKIIDRYILKKFLSTFLLILFGITAITLLIDFTEKADYYSNYNLSVREIAGYYCAFLPFMINLLTPIIVFITTVWVTTVLSQRTEIIAMLSSGISFPRFAVPYLIGALCITVANFYLMGWWLATANKHRVAFEENYLDFMREKGSDTQNIYLKVGPAILYIKEYHPYSKTGLDVQLDTIKGNQLIERLFAKKMHFIVGQKWEFTDWIRRTMDPFGDKIEEGKTLKMMFNIDPEDFSMNPRLREAFTLPELNRHIKKLQEKGSDNVHIFVAERHIRYMSPCAVLILTCLALFVSAYKSRGGIGTQITVGFILALIYIALFLSAKIVSEAQGTNSAFNIWLPNIIFSILCIGYYRLVPK